MKNYQESKQIEDSLNSRNKNIATEKSFGELPGQVCVPGSRHLGNAQKMNSPGGLGDHSSEFSGMYESDSKYRWRKVKGNLDLFVMERNERHLTSLQWKWQKMSKSRRRTPVYEGYPGDGQADEVYKPMPESARTRSRAESRQRMREDLDACFYDRWKTAESRHKKSDLQGKLAPKEEISPTRFKSGKEDSFKPYQTGVGDSSKWSRYGINSEQPSDIPYNNAYTAPNKNSYLNGSKRGARKPTGNSRNSYPDPYLQAEYLGSNVSQAKYSEDYNRTYSTQFNNGYTPYFQENEEETNPYWRSKSRYPASNYSGSQDHAYPNYNYTPDYRDSSMYPPMYKNPPSHAYQPHIHPHPADHSIPTVFDCGAPNMVDPWMKKSGFSPQYPGNNYFNNELEAEVQRNRNKELTCQLLNDQHEMELELHNLKKVLKAEMRHQDDNDSVNNRFNRKIEDIEKQIEQLDFKLNETTDKLKQSELEKKEIADKLASERDQHAMPPQPPLFIISDPHSGTAAALTHGSHPYGSNSSSYLDSSTPSNCGRSTCLNQIYGVADLVSLPINTSSIDVTLHQQEQLKADLESQMAVMRAEMEKQLQEQRTQTGLDSKFIIDERVADLEKQIEDMKNKILSTETVIKNVELKKSEIKRKAKSENSPKETNKNKKEKSKNDNKSLKSKLSLSPKVTPAQERKHEFNNEALNSEYYNNENKFFRSKKSPDAKVKNSPSSPLAGKDKESKCSISVEDSPRSLYPSRQTRAGFKTSNFSSSKPRSTFTSKSTTSDHSEITSIEMKPNRPNLDGKNLDHREATITTIDSEFTQMSDESNTKSSTSHSGPMRKAGRGWDLHKTCQHWSLLYGLGSTWCVCPEKIWKYFGDESDDEPITRRKCISLIMGTILALLLLAVVLGLIIGIALSEGPTESPIRFVVVPNDDYEDGT